MDKNINIKYDIAPLWGIVKEIRNEVESLLKGKDKELAYAGKMIASELIENAIKYGSAAEQEKGIMFDLHADIKQVVIKVSNEIKFKDDYDNLVTHIDKINSTDDIKGLYVERLKKLMESPKEKSQLGLYRIAYEGKFNLKYEYENNLVTVIAYRNY